MIYWVSFSIDDQAAGLAIVVATDAEHAKAQALELSPYRSEPVVDPDCMCIECIESRMAGCHCPGCVQWRADGSPSKQGPVSPHAGKKIDWFITPMEAGDLYDEQVEIGKFYTPHELIEFGIAMKRRDDLLHMVSLPGDSNVYIFEGERLLYFGSKESAPSHLREYLEASGEWGTAFRRVSGRK